MPFSATVAIDPTAVLPPGSRVRLAASGIFDQSFAVTTPGSFDNWLYPAPLTAPFALDIEVFVGAHPPIRLVASIPSDNSKLAFHVLPGTPQEPRFFFAGDIFHQKQIAATCQATCTTGTATAGPGQCVECENEAAIVKVCC